MRNSKLHSILDQFDRYEQNRLRKYLTSPYFNRSQTLVDLFELLLADINNGQQGELEKKVLWEGLGLDAPYDDVRFRKYSSDLLKLVEGFLAQQVYENNPLHQATYLIEAVGQKKLEKLYNSTMRSARRLSRQQPHQPASYFYYQYEVEKNYYELTQFEIKRTDRSNVEKIVKNLDYFYLAEKLKFYCSILSRQYVVSHEYELLFIEEIISYIQEFNFEDIPAIGVYYQIYLTQTDSSREEHYFKLRALLEKYHHYFPRKEAYVIYTYALNYCIRKANQGNSHFLKELFELYKTLLYSEVIFVNDNKLSPWAFKNITQSALRLKEYAWAEEFIEAYNDRLPENFRINAVTYNLAQLYFYQKQYDKVIEKLRDVEFEDFSYNLNSKSMLLATYYETDEIEPLYSLMDSFRTYLNRHKDFPEERRKLYTNLIKYTKRLTKIIPGDKKLAEKLKTEIESTKNIASIAWLREKVAELENG